MSASSGLDVSYRRMDAVGARHLAGPSGLLRASAVLAVLLATGGTLAGLVYAAHRPAGVQVTGVWPAAFDGTALFASAAVTLVFFVSALVLAALGLGRQPRTWAYVSAGAVLLLASLAMVTVVLTATEENPMPPDGALAIPILVPLALAILGESFFGRARRCFFEEGARAKVVAVGLAALAGALFFVVVETTKLASLIPPLR